jgi:hypothetical protein
VKINQKVNVYAAELDAGVVVKCVCMGGNQHRKTMRVRACVRACVRAYVCVRACDFVCKRLL